ncbi:hypothetical protein [Rudaeicoccus suwonensis]|nr:hypothetical protein [Rudaeicoccus suwonensis]
MKVTAVCRSVPMVLVSARFRFPPAAALQVPVRLMPVMPVMPVAV